MKQLEKVKKMEFKNKTKDWMNQMIKEKELKMGNSESDQANSNISDFLVGEI